MVLCLSLMDCVSCTVHEIFNNEPSVGAVTGQVGSLNVDDINSGQHKLAYGILVRGHEHIEAVCACSEMLNKCVLCVTSPFSAELQAEAAHVANTKQKADGKKKEVKQKRKKLKDKHSPDREKTPGPIIMSSGAPLLIYLRVGSTEKSISAQLPCGTIALDAANRAVIKNHDPFQKWFHAVKELMKGHVEQDSCLSWDYNGVSPE